MTSKREIVAELTAKHAVAAKERWERERANLGDVAEFMTQQQREEQVGVWLELSVSRLETDAAKRRAKFRGLAGAALSSIVARGVSLKEAAELVGLPQSKVQEYLAAAADAVGDALTAAVKDVAVIKPEPEAPLSW